MKHQQSDEEVARLIHEATLFYAKNYDLKIWRVGRSSSGKVFLGSATNRKCRFCRRSEPDVSFRNNAHAIPEALGNNTIFSNYECDVCNQEFGETIENDFGNWFLPRRMLAGLKGKNEYPKIKSRDRKSRLDWRDTGLHVDNADESDFFIADEESKTLQLNLDVPSYTPVNVWRAFVKMGISLVEESRYRYFSDAVAWVKGDLKPNERVRTWPIQSYAMPGPSKITDVTIAMLYRNNDWLKLPYAMLLINYGIHSFQVHIPSSAKDFMVEDGGIDMPLVPMFSAVDIKQYGVPQLIELDLSGDQVVKGERFTVRGTYSGVTEL